MTIMNSQAEPLQCRASGPGAAAPAIIELAGVEKVYGSGRVSFPALSGVSLVISAGEMVAITGPSGSGKSTIINLIAGIDRPTAGTVTVAASRLDQMSEDKLAAWRGHTLGIVFQFFQLMPTLTAIENATLPLDLARVGPPRERRVTAGRNLATVGLADRVDPPPLGLSRRGASAGGSRAPGRCPAPRRSCSATSQPATSTPGWRGTCSSCSSA